MVKNSLETAPNTVKFDSLVDLKTELGKNTQDRERLGEFEKTIDEAMQEGEKQGVIEFTEDEWKSLITNEKLPPIEVQKQLLKEKIEKRKEITEGAKEQKKGFMHDVEKTITGKVENIKDSATEKIKALKEKAEKIKQLSKPGLLFLGIGLSLKLWGYKAMKWFSGLFGEKGKYDEDIKKIEMEQEFIRDPEAALKKYGAEAKEKFEAGKEGALEKGKEVISKIPALAAISAVAVSIYAVARKFLPKSVTDTIKDEKDGASILKVLKGRNFLKLFGAGGLALLGAGGLFYYFSKNPDKLKSLGDMPEDTEGRKSWWQRALGVAGISDSEGGNHIISYLNGGKIEQKLEQQPLEEGKVWLKDHPMYKNTMGKLEELGNKLLLMQKENPAAFKATLAAIGLVAGAGFVISASTKAVDIARTFLIAATRSAGKHPIMWAGGLIAGVSGLTALAHMQIKEDASVDDIREMVWGIFDYDDFKNNIDWMPDLIEAPIDKVADCLRDNGAVLANFISDFCEKFWEKTGQATRDWLILDTNERISSKNTEGLEAFMLDLKVMNVGNTKELCGEDQKSGVLGAIISKIKKDEKITEKDVYTMMQATRGTKIRIFPEGGSREEGRFIQFVTLDENNQPIGMEKNICLNPAISESSQAEASREFSYNPHETNAAMKALGDIWEGGRNLISDLTIAMTAGENEKSKALADKVIQSGGVFMQAGGNLLLQYGEALILLPKMAIEQIIPGGKSYTGQEFICEYAGSILPVFAVGLVGQKIFFRNKNKGVLRILAESVTFPVTMPVQGTKLAKSIFDRFQKGDLAGIIRDPSVSIKDRFFGRLKSTVPFAADIRMKGKLQRVRGILEKQKWYKDFGMEQTAGYKSLEKELQGLVDGTGKEGKLRELLGIQHSNDLYKAKNSITDIDIAIDGINKKLSPEAIAQLREEAAKAAEKGELNTGGNKLSKFEKAKLALDAKEKMISKKEQGLMKKILEDKKAGKDISKLEQTLENLRADNADIKDTIKKMRINLDLQISGKPPIHTIPKGKFLKLKMRGRGVITILGALGLAYVGSEIIEGIKGKDSGSYRDKSAQEVIDESIPDEDGIDYFGYEEGEYDETDDEILTESSDTHCENVKDFENKVTQMEQEYLSDFDFLNNENEIKNLSDEKINKICESHNKKAEYMKKLIGNNKQLLTEFWKGKNPGENGSLDNVLPKELENAKLKAFMAIFNKNGRFTLEIMDTQDMKNILINVREGANNGIGKNILKGGASMVPFVGNAVPAYDAYKDFSNGNIKSGFWNVGWAVGGLALDVAGLFSFGGGNAAAAGVRAARIATMAGKVVINGGAGSLIEQYFDNARSESIDIDALSEDIK